jgi:hypothetical protein
MRISTILDKPTATVEELAKKYNTTSEEVQAQLDQGMKVEQEHTSHESVARQIALAHLGEDLHYYEKLQNIEQGVNEQQVPGTQFVTLNASQLKEALTYLQELAENIDSVSITYSDNTTIYSKLDKDYKAITAVEYVMKNNMKALKDPQLAQDSIFLYDIDDSDLSYIEFVGAIHVVVAHKVAEVKWIGSYDANGAGLLRAAMQIAKQRGALEMKLEAKWQSEGFYTKMGFEQAGASVDQPFSGSQLTPFKKKLAEKWSKKYKKSINCNSPKGFSQRAHCAGKKKSRSVVKEATTRTSKVGAPGTLKAKISGPVTCDKVKKLKNRANATPHDVRQANWFINMHDCKESTLLTELFDEPAQHVKWKHVLHGDYQFFETDFIFEFLDKEGKKVQKKVEVGMYEDHEQTSARFVTRNTDLDLPAYYKGYHVVFSVDGSTDATGEVGNAAGTLFVEVVKRVKGFLINYPWNYVFFVGGEESRDRLYFSLSQRLASQVGAKVATYRSYFLIYRPFPLQEVFDYKLSRDDWKVKQRPNGINIDFKVDHDPYLLEITEFKKTPGIFKVIFSHTGVSMFDDATGILNTGNAFQVFAAVAQLLQHATEKMRIKALYFTAKEPSRIKLYKALTKYFATKLGWKFTTDPQFIPYKSKEAQFLVYKPGFSITEHVHLQEVFNVKLARRDWEVVEQGKNYSIFKFHVEDTPYDLDFMELRGRPGIYDVVFGQADSTDPISITGVGQASKVFAAVAQLVQKAIQHHHAQGIAFTAVEPSRKKLYDALSKLFAQKMGWQVVTDPKLMPPHGEKEKPYLIMDPTMQEAAGVGLVVPGVNMPAGMHKDEIRRQAAKFGNLVSATGVPPIADTSGKIPKPA